MLLISIPKPCHENWNGMSPQEKGRFCQVCSKTVVDFTSLSDEQVKNYFLQQAGQKTCGRFRSGQLTNTDNVLPRLLQSSIPFWKKFLAIVLILFGSLLTACNQSTMGKEKLQADKEADKNLTLTGVTIMELDSTVIPDQLENASVGQCSSNVDSLEDVDVFVGMADYSPPVFVGDSSSCERDPEIDSVKEKTWDQHGREIIKPAASKNYH